MKIGIDCRLWDETGVGRYIRNLVKNLQTIDKSNEYVLFVLSKDYERVKFQIRNSKFQIRRADIKWHTLEEQINLPFILNKENLDLMHFPYISVPFFYNKPFIITIHDLIPYHFSTGEASTLFLPLYKFKFLGYKFILSMAAKKTKKIISVSNATKKEILDHLRVGASKVAVIYEGVFSNSKLPTSLKLRGASKIPNAKYFLYVGNVFPHKNINRLLEALSILCHPERSEGSHDIRLIFVGREDYFYKRVKEKTKNLGLEKSVIFLGEVSDEKLSSLYKNALALVMPSLMEGFGLPALEAMANKCLVLASNIPSLREVCGDAAIYFDPYDVKDISKKMEASLLNDSNHFTQNIRNGFERTKMFTWEKMAKETLAVYEQATSHP